MSSLRSLPSKAVIAAVLPFVGSLVATPARANPASDTGLDASGAPAAVPPKRSRFELLATGGYGHATAEVRNLEVQPYNALLGLDLGYSFRSGFRIGAAVGYGFGQTVAQRHVSRNGNAFDLAFDASSVSVGTSVAYDVPLFSLKLRYSLAFGAMFMKWDMGGVPPDSVFSDLSLTSPASGFFLAPGLAVLWSHEALQCGAGFDYYVQANDGIPPGVFGKLLVGVKL